MAVEVLAICGNNAMSSFIFFGSNEESDMANFCNLVGCLKFRTEFECRSNMMLKVSEIVNNDSLKKLLEKYDFVWNFIVPRVSCSEFCRAILGTYDSSNTENGLWYTYLYHQLYADEITSINFITLREFNDSEKKICLNAHFLHEMEWRRVLEKNIEFIQEHGIDEFRCKIDLENGYYSEGAS